jgi:hypothetical protein
VLFITTKATLMTRQRSSKVIDRAQLRIANLKSIDSTLDLDNGLSIDALMALIDETRKMIQTYNIALATIEQTSNQVRDREKSIADMSERLLFGVASRYGKNSEEYRRVSGLSGKSRRRATRSPEPKSSAVAKPRGMSNPVAQLAEQPALN